MFGFTSFATAPFAALGSVSVEVQLTGVQAEALLRSLDFPGIGGTDGANVVCIDKGSFHK